MDKLQQEIDDLLHGVPEHVGALAWTQDVIAVLKQAATALQSSGGEVVGWCALTPSGKIAMFDGKPMFMAGSIGNEHHPTPLYASPAQPSDGYVLVPVEPTREMREAWGKAPRTPWLGTVNGDTEAAFAERDFANKYAAMLTAAPAPIEQEG